MRVADISKDKPVIAWWSGGVTSAVTCMICIDTFGLDNVRIVFQDTHNEYDDTYVFKAQCEKWYGKKIETISNPRYKNIQQVWYENRSLNVATGAICSSELKRVTREIFEASNAYSYQAFGFDITEINRALGMKNNNPSSKPIFPLIWSLLNKKQCIKIIEKANDVFLTIDIPKAYKMGYNNNNCGKTGCVQGGIGYWQLKKELEPDQFYAMAKVEHDLTDMKGEPVTMLKDQSKKGGLVFLMPHPKYPHMKDISMMKGRPPAPLMECNGFCGTNDLRAKEVDKTAKEINFVTV